MLGVSFLKNWPWKTARVVPHCSVEEWNEIAKVFQENIARLASLEAKLAAIEQRLSCGHRKIDMDNSYGDCILCGFKKGYEEYETENEQLESRLAEVENERDAAADWIRTVGDELIMAGYPGGDRAVKLANFRKLLSERDALTARLAGAEEKLADAEKRLALLDALEEAGVDNWEGYDAALEML